MLPTAQNTIYNLKNPQKNSFKVTKNHYNDYQANCFISANTDIEFFIIESGKTINDPAIIEREPNVCMTELRPDLSEGYEPNRVGISDTWFTYLWSDSIKRYLDPEYQIITPDTVENFKNVFVNQLSTTRVSTLYTSPSSIENNYTLDKHHGYVWDRCFIPEEKEFVENCLTFMPINNICDISFNYMPGPRTLFDFEYSLNGGDTWNAYSFSQNGIGQTITLSPGGNTSIKFRRALSNTGTTLSSGYYYYYYFAMTGTCTATGNITSLLDGYGLSTTEITSEYCFSKLFYNCDGLRSAPELPSTTLADYCYFLMFQGCTSLTTAPELPATTLANHCYSYMFNGCTSLTTAPELSATTLADYCYRGMFNDCTSLTAAPALPATVLNEGCFEEMFRGCTSLSTAPTISRSPGMQKNCFKNMFYGCTSLTTMPYTGSTFPWQSHAYGCYEGMFQNCTSLINTPSTIFGYNARDYCFKKMFYGCTSMTNPITLYANNLGSLSGVCESMFEGCTSLASGITANSVKIGPDCYKKMFYGCTNMTYIKANFSATTEGVFNSNNASAFTQNWVSGVSQNGTFMCANSTWYNNYAFNGTNGIPNNWRIGY